MSGRRCWLRPILRQAQDEVCGRGPRLLTPPPSAIYPLMTQSSPEPKLQIRLVPVTPLQQNCSLIWDTQTKHAAFVDPGGDIDQLMGALDHFGLTLKKIWLTHGHMDHAGAAAELRERTGVAIEGPHAGRPVLARPDRESSAKKYGIDRRPQRDARPLSRRRRHAGARRRRLRRLPHAGPHARPCGDPQQAPAKIAFVGDVLFAGSIGRTDFPKGNHQDLIDSHHRQAVAAGRRHHLRARPWPGLHVRPGTPVQPLRRRRADGLWRRDQDRSVDLRAEDEQAVHLGRRPPPRRPRRHRPHPELVEGWATSTVRAAHPSTSSG